MSANIDFSNKLSQSMAPEHLTHAEQVKGLAKKIFALGGFITLVGIFCWPVCVIGLAIMALGGFTWLIVKVITAVSLYFQKECKKKINTILASSRLDKAIEELDRQGLLYRALEIDPNLINRYRTFINPSRKKRVETILRVYPNQALSMLREERLIQIALEINPAIRSSLNKKEQQVLTLIEKYEQIPDLIDKLIDELTQWKLLDELRILRPDLYDDHVSGLIFYN